MSRHLITANKKIFELLDEFCARHDVLLQNRASPRWIASNSRDKDFMMHAVVSMKATLTATRRIARIEWREHSFMCTVGFERQLPLDSCFEIPVTAAHLTVAFSELLPRPIVTPLSVKDVVEFSDRASDETYNGHDPEQIAKLFPGVRVFEIDLDSSATWNAFFKMCIEEREFVGSWIAGDLAHVLRALADLDADRIPYAVLCRSIFDEDPGSFFLALYRCLESLYWFGNASDVVDALKLQQSWSDVAAVLEDILGWHPREEQSLATLMTSGTDADLRNMLLSLGVAEPWPVEKSGLAQLAARRLYWLRNSIVHYRPAHQKVALEGIDWIRVCGAMVGIVLDVYDSIFSAA